MAAKSIKLKCVDSDTLYFDANRLYKGKIGDDGVTRVSVPGGKSWVALDGKLSMTTETLDGGTKGARFVQLKTKTLKCMRLIGAQKAGTFKAGKRYQVESCRALGSVAGYIFDESGEPWTLYRESVGFSCACALFEAKYL